MNVTGQAIATPDSGFWAGKRVLVTGHSGFKGGWACWWLHRMGAEVHGLSDRTMPEPSFYSATGLTEVLASETWVDIAEAGPTVAAIEKIAPQVVLHMAAQPLVRLSYSEPISTYATNVMGTVHVLEAIRRSSSVKSAVMITTDKCYENREWEWGYREDEAMGGWDPYSSSKGCCELAVSAFRRSYGLDGSDGKAAVASARAGNVIGGGDWAGDRLIPDIVRSFTRGESVEIRSPNAVRPWQHVIEPVCGYLVLAERLWSEGGSFAEGWNFGPEDADATPVGAIVETMVNLWGDGAAWHLAADAGPHEAKNLKLDISKVKSRLKWRPRLRLAHTLDWLVAWYRAHDGGADAAAMRDLTLEQLARYEALGSGKGAEAEAVHAG
ncbi:MAG: CDP-glucose 4,6-dehydratase [Planctomycetota bacterium]